MPNRSSQRNDRGLGQQIHQKVQGDTKQAQQQRQLDQLDQLDHMFRDLGVIANLDPSNSLPSRVPRQHNRVQGDGTTEGTTSILRETSKSYAVAVGGTQTTCKNGVQLTYTNGTPAARPNGATPNNILTPTINEIGTSRRNITRGPHSNPTTPQETGITPQINEVQFPNLNVPNTPQESSPRKTAQLVPVTPLIQPRNDCRNSFDTSKSPAPPQLPAMERPCPIPRTNHTTRNPSRTTLAHGSPRLGLGTRSPTLERVRQLPTTPVRPTSPTLDRIQELRRVENGIKNKAPTQPSGRINRAQGAPLCGRNIRAEWMETNLSTESFNTAPLNPSAASFAPTSRRQDDSEIMLHLPLEIDVAEDGIVAIEQEVLIVDDEADEFEVIENVSC